MHLMIHDHMQCMRWYIRMSSILHTFTCVYVWLLYELAYKTRIICTYLCKYLMLLLCFASHFNNKLYNLFRAPFTRIQISAATAQIPYLSLYWVLARYIHFCTHSTTYFNHDLPYQDELSTNSTCSVLLVVVLFIFLFYLFSSR